ncbi:hypothetical protein ADJ76_01710 [Schaalia meyeri]|nr:hypothetical protein ADJ76_01710 [Schaalia meyeri]OFQ23889.1 hypothetical protein HMPREF2946_02345 [Actinomyces sp. HMSC062G12]
MSAPWGTAQGPAPASLRNAWPPCGEGRWNPSQTYATKFISPSFGFAMGRNFWFNWAITVAADLVPSGLVMYYWFSTVPSWVWAGGILGVAGVFMIAGFSFQGTELVGIAASESNVAQSPFTLVFTHLGVAVHGPGRAVTPAPHGLTGRRCWGPCP